MSRLKAWVIWTLSVFIVSPFIISIPHYWYLHAVIWGEYFAMVTIFFITIILVLSCFTAIWLLNSYKPKE